MLELDTPVNLTAVGEHRWTNTQLKRELQLHNLALRTDGGSRGDDLLAALAKAASRWRQARHPPSRHTGSAPAT